MTVKVGQIYRNTVATHIKEGVQKRGNIFLITYTKVSSAQMDGLRKTLKKVGAKMYVSKKTIAERTLKDLQFDTLANRLKGQTAFIWGDIDSVEVSKTLTKFTKECQGVLVHGGLLDGKVIEAVDVKRLSDLPSREALLTMLLGAMQSPLVGLLGALNGKTQELLSLLKQLSEQKGEGGK